MKGLKLLLVVIKRMHFDKILGGFLLWFFISALIIMAAEPGIANYRDAVWYTFVACTSIGFGDLVAVTPVGRILTAITTVYEIVIAAMFSGAVVSYYLEVIHRREKLTATMFLDKMEHLSELSHEELVEIEEKIRKLKI